LRLPQNSSPPLNCCTTCKMTYFTHPDICSPFLENRLPSDLLSSSLPT
jgi:hypothetical protein